MLLHVVFYQPRESASAEERQALIKSLGEACLEIPVIKQVRVGKAANLGMGYENRSETSKMEYAAIFEFDTKDDLVSYLTHEKHTRLAEMFWKVCDQTMIVDLNAVDPLSGGSIRSLVE